MEIHKLQQLLSEMSLQEKIGQMVQLTGVYFDKEAVLTGVVGEQLPPEWVIQYAGSVLGVIGKEKICDIQSKYMEQHPHHIPLLFMADVIHGCRTIFPIPLGQACSFHPELVSEAASIAASEASSEGLKATFSPMIDVSRDPRWGRMLESFGEDPYVNGVMGEAMVDGYQQKNDEGIAACLKHFAGYGAVNAGREYNDVEISQRTFLEQYVKPFRMALKAKPAMVMTAFNAIDRKPISGNKELLRDLLRDKEGFDGTVISDWGSIGQLEEQGVAADMDEAAVQAIEAGVDIDMMSPAYMFRLEELVKNGQIPESFIDESAFRVLMMKNQLGLFENPFAGLGKSTIVLGGGLVGCEAAADYIDHGVETTIVEMKGALMPETTGLYRTAVHDFIDKNGGKYEVNAKVVKVGKDFVVAEQDGKEITIKADSVVNAMGRRAHATEALETALKEAGIPVWKIGDCVRARQIGDAVREGWTAAMEII